MTTDMLHSEFRKDSWPSSPYKGLSYYGPRDSKLFSGRDEDIWQCARMLDHPSTRILMLHGVTGCGKSSFLRAGLIPLLEDPVAGFRFLAANDVEEAKALFIRCTDRPLEVISESLAEYVSRGLKVQTPLGTKELDLRKALPEGANDDNVAEIMCSDVEHLNETLRRLSTIVPQTLTLIIDQGEEVLTLNQTADGEEARLSFFKFLTLFTRSDYDIKIVIAIRTEYYGRFCSRVRTAFADMLRLREYFLDELTVDQLRAAILRPTSADVECGSPRNVYKFTYEPGLPEKIIQDLSTAVVTGGLLPVLQLVCSTLYERTRARDPGATQWEISMSDYIALGGPEGQVEEHLDSILLERARGQGESLRQSFREVDRWKNVLFKLVRSQADGSATTEIVKETELIELIKENRCVLDGKSTLEFLAQDKVRLLREVFVLDRVSRVIVRCYSLGHDTLGLVLRRWKALRDQMIKRARKSVLMMRSLSLVVIAMGGIIQAILYYNVWPFASKYLDPGLLWGVMFYGVLFFVMSLVQKSYMVGGVPSPLMMMAVRVFILMYPTKILEDMLKRPGNKAMFQAYPDVREMLLARLVKKDKAGLSGVDADSAVAKR